MLPLDSFENLKYWEILSSLASSDLACKSSLGNRSSRNLKEIHLFIFLQGRLNSCEINFNNEWLWFNNHITIFRHHKLFCRCRDLYETCITIPTRITATIRTLLLGLDFNMLRIMWNATATQKKKTRPKRTDSWGWGFFSCCCPIPILACIYRAWLWPGYLSSVLLRGSDSSGFSHSTLLLTLLFFRFSNTFIPKASNVVEIRDDVPSSLEGSPESCALLYECGMLLLLGLFLLLALAMQNGQAKL